MAGAIVTPEDPRRSEDARRAEADFRARTGGNQQEILRAIRREARNARKAKLLRKYGHLDPSREEEAFLARMALAEEAERAEGDRRALDAGCEECLMRDEEVTIEERALQFATDRLEAEAIWEEEALREETDRAQDAPPPPASRVRPPSR
ncbi:MAG: hypothetical protein LBT40_00055 [Deltaproteobacteria bacterium]|jgi:hypothetical protein|nr:hypothetical protein [Deltaproteobacteria bacterium]